MLVPTLVSKLTHKIAMAAIAKRVIALVLTRDSYYDEVGRGDYRESKSLALSFPVRRCVMCNGRMKGTGNQHSVCDSRSRLRQACISRHALKRRYLPTVEK